MADPSVDLDLFRRTDGRLVLRQTRDGKAEETPVQVACCFPWSRSDEFISLRDDKGREQVLVERLAAAPPAAQALIEEDLAQRVFVPRVTAIEAILEQAELFHWQVMTTSGPRSFLTARSDYMRSLPGGKVLIKDVGNDLYLIENPAALDAKSRKLLWVYLD
jgi:hypothetical protein